MKIDKSVKVSDLKTLMEFIKIPVQQINKLEELINALPATEDAWVSAGDIEKIPINVVIVLTSMGYIGTGDYDFDLHMWHIAGIGPANNVTHWQPLPSKPTKAP